MIASIVDGERKERRLEMMGESESGDCLLMSKWEDNNKVSQLMSHLQSKNKHT